MGVLNENVYVGGNLGCLTFSPPASCITTQAIVANAITGGLLTTTLATGYVPLDLFGARLIASNNIPAIASTGGLLAQDTAPALIRTNAGTDKSINVKWAASSVAELQLGPFEYPPDLDASQPIVINIRAKMSGSTDTPVLTVGYWEQEPGTNLGGNTAALSSAMATVTFSVAAPSTPPAFATITITPGAHGTDAVEIFSVWITYTRK